MSVLTHTDVRMFLNDYLRKKLGADGHGTFSDLPDDCDLLLSGMIDSIGLLDLMAALQGFAGCEIDFEFLDPEEMTIVGPLCKFVSEEINRHG